MDSVTLFTIDYQRVHDLSSQRTVFIHLNFTVEESLNFELCVFVVKLMLGVASCATDETKPLVTYLCEPVSKSLFRVAHSMYGFEYMPWLALFHWPIRLKGNFKHTSGYSLTPLGTQTKNLGAASQTLLAWVRLL